MPSGLWRSGNLLILPGGDLHFCIAPTSIDQAVRTVDWNGRTLARGHEPVVHSDLEGEGAVVLVLLRWVVAAAVALGLIVAFASWSRSRRHS